MNEHEEKKDFIVKKISQTEYRGSKYYSFFSRSSQFLIQDFPEDLRISEQGKSKLKMKALKSIQHFLSKTVSEEVANTILKDDFIKRLLKQANIL
jgi:hypothetical protein